MNVQERRHDLYFVFYILYFIVTRKVKFDEAR